MTADRQAGKEAAMKKSTWLSYETRIVEGLPSVTVTEEEYEKVPPDFKGLYCDYYGDRPELEGRRTLCIPGEEPGLFVEGATLRIV